MKKIPPQDATTPTARGPRLQRKTLRVLTQAQLGAVNGARRATLDTGTTGWFNDCNTFDTAVGC
jgi:hypothetical protein